MGLSSRQLEKTMASRFILILILVSLTLVCGSGLQSCGSGNMTVTFINSTTIRCMPCERFETCPPGFGWSLECDTKMVHTKDQIECLNCVEGETFSSHDNREKCQPCKRTTCLKYEIVEGTCTIDKDTTICTGICEKGYIMNHQNKTCQHLENKTEEDIVPTEMPHMPISTSEQEKEKDLHRNATGQSFKNLTGGHVVSTTMPTTMPYSSNSADPGREREGYGVFGHPLLFGLTNAKFLILALLYILYIKYGKRLLEKVRCRRNGQDLESALPVDDSDNNSCGGCGSGENTEPGENTELLDLQCPNNNAGLQQVLSALPSTLPSLSTPCDTPPPKRPIQQHPETGIDGRKVCELNAGVYDMVCRKLNHDIDGKDWRTLAGRMGYNSEQVKNFKLESNSADALLSHWATKSENGVTKLVELLVEMDRGDIVEKLESEYI